MADALSFNTAVGRPSLAVLNSAPAGTSSLASPTPTPPSPPASAANTNHGHAQPDGTGAFGRAWLRVREFLGLAGPSSRRQRERRKLVQFFVFLALCFVQVFVIIVSTAFAAERKSPQPQRPGQTELQACTILGAWNLIWLARLLVKGYIISWFFPRGPPSPTDAICPLSLRALHILLYKLDPFVTLIWFFSAILVVYAHGSRCRSAASDISAATYFILILIYVQFVVRNTMPIVRAIMMRRRAGRPTIDKLSRAEVDRIPLVLYIPPPPDDAPKGPITPLPRALSHPPVTPLPSAWSPPEKKRRFIFFRPSTKRRKTVPADPKPGDRDLTTSPGADADDVDDWDKMWEPAQYPFVRLPENRATCGICLSEFEAPRRLNGRAPDGEGEDECEGHEMRTQPADGDASAAIQEVRVESPRPADAHTVQFADSDSSDAPEPLRLLGCGHVFHVRPVHIFAVRLAIPSGAACELSAVVRESVVLTVATCVFAEGLCGPVADGEVGTVPVLPGEGRGAPSAAQEHGKEALAARNRVGASAGVDRDGLRDDCDVFFACLLWLLYSASKLARYLAVWI
ncbi:hypothetical protein C8Q80DRAFT_1172929 [Daedaleopsis nitida]|nr:hypothetical protein C8Q80DRAFT_1172929 [Daedaleopsis nitida]